MMDVFKTRNQTTSANYPLLTYNKPKKITLNQSLPVSISRDTSNLTEDKKHEKLLTDLKIMRDHEAKLKLEEETKRKAKLEKLKTQNQINEERDNQIVYKVRHDIGVIKYANIGNIGIHTEQDLLHWIISLQLLDYKFNSPSPEISSFASYSQYKAYFEPLYFIECGCQIQQALQLITPTTYQFECLSFQRYNDFIRLEIRYERNEKVDIKENDMILLMSEEGLDYFHKMNKRHIYDEFIRHKNFSKFGMLGIIKKKIKWKLYEVYVNGSAADLINHLCEISLAKYKKSCFPLSVVYIETISTLLREYRALSNFSHNHYEQIILNPISKCAVTKEPVEETSCYINQNSKHFNLSQSKVLSEVNQLPMGCVKVIQGPVIY